MSNNFRVVTAIVVALLAAGAGALAAGLEDAPLAGVSAVLAVVAAALMSLGLAPGVLRRASASDEEPADGLAPETAGSEPRLVADPSPTTDVRLEQPHPRPRAEAGPGREETREPQTPPTDPLRSVPSDVPEAAADLVDPVTGFLDHRYFVVALERRLAASRRKLDPFALVLLELRPDDPARPRITDQSMKVLSAVVRAVLRDSDTGCRLDDHTLGLLLEDTGEAGAVWATERVRAGFFATTFRGNVRLAAGIAAYPAHALEPDRLLGAARDAVRRSRQGAEESIEIAPADETAGPEGGSG